MKTAIATILLFAEVTKSICGITAYDTQQISSYQDLNKEIINLESVFENNVESANTEQEIIFEESDNVYNDFHYWMYKPQTTKEDEKLPLIVYLHGMGERGGDINVVINAAGLPKAIVNNPARAITIAPQIPINTTWFQQEKYIIDLINHIKETENVDENNINLTGVSMGGMATFNLAINNPSLFHKIAPVCASVNAEACKNLKMPVWIFHGSEDTAMGFSVYDAEKIINEHGGNADLTILEGEGHAIGTVYERFEIAKWLIE